MYHRFHRIVVSRPGLVWTAGLALLAATGTSPADGFHFDYSGSPILLQVHIQAGNRTMQHDFRTFDLCNDPSGVWDDLRLFSGGEYVAGPWGIEDYTNSSGVAGDSAWADVIQVSGPTVGCLSYGTPISPGSTYVTGGTMAYEIYSQFGWSGTDGAWENKTGYIGLRAQDGGTTYYGWMKCQVANYCTMSPWLKVYEWAMFSDDMGPVRAGQIPGAASGVFSKMLSGFDPGSDPAGTFDAMDPGALGSITVEVDPTDPGNGVLRLSHPDGSEPVILSKTCDAEAIFDLAFKYMFATDGKLEVLLGGALLETIQAPAAGPGRDSFATFQDSYDLAAYGLTPGQLNLEFRLSNSGDPVVYMDDMEIVTQVPEPAMLSLVVLGVPVLLRRRRSR